MTAESSDAPGRSAPQSPVAGQDCYLFIGPSLDASDARARFSGTVLPPVGRGDLDALLELKPRKVGVVDGRFLQSLAVSPKEILRALDAGVQVFGSSSIGALRAAECSSFGMIGIGRVFQMYAAGVVERDDEVAVSFDPESGRGLSIPLVNIRAAMDDTVSRGCLKEATARAVVEIADSLWFPRRTWASIGMLLRARVGEHEVGNYRAYVFGPDVFDLKRADALLLLDAMAEGERAPDGNARP